MRDNESCKDCECINCEYNNNKHVCGACMDCEAGNQCCETILSNDI